MNTPTAASVFEALSATRYPAVEQRVTTRDAMLYALGIGLGSDPLDADQLRFVYEKDLRVFPTMAVTLCYPAANRGLHAALDMRKVLHAFQSFEMHAPIPLKRALKGQTRVTGVFDCRGDERRLSKMEARFSSPVFPGETIRTELWREGEAALFRCSVTERGIVVLDQGLAGIGAD